jgi:ferrochelatase
VLLIQLGTPDGGAGGPTTAQVRRYLAEFLSDPRVIDIPAVPRWLMLHAAVLRTRPRRSAAAYRKIWTAAGSPLRIHSEAQRDALATALGPGFHVTLGMRYGRPSMVSAMADLERAKVCEIVAIPMFPQYSSAASASAIARCYEVAAKLHDPPPLCILDSLHTNEGFLDAQAVLARTSLEGFDADHVLFSYHGVPERQLRRTDGTGTCFASAGCCEALGTDNPRCYRAQCFATTRALVERLDLATQQTSTSFQSRLGRTPWIKPYTDEVLPDLAKAGARRLVVMCPSFLADCLETVEEIGIRAVEQWRELGGEELRLVPCVNAHPRWVDGLAEWVRARAGFHG